MSRTRHNRKDPSFEYWSARPFNRCGQIPGRFAKRRTHKAERQQVPAIVEEEMVELDDPNDEVCQGCGGVHDTAAAEADCLEDVATWGGPIE